MRKVLIITYYWPPSGGSQVMRWLKFAKYLREYNWEPVVYTPSNPESQEQDNSLLNDVPEGLQVIKSRIWEPYRMYKWITGRKKNEKLGVGFIVENKKPGVMNKIALWIRSNFFIPDPRIFWVRPSVRLLIKYLRQNPVDVIITTGPPHSMHLIGSQVGKKTGIKWVADFRDPWTKIDFYADLDLTAWADRKHKHLENKVLTEADHIITVGPTMTTEFQSMGARNVSTITNGFDGILAAIPLKNARMFTLLHLGSIPHTRNPENLWHILSELTKQNQLFAQVLEVTLAGKTDYKVKESLRDNNLLKYTKFQTYLPNNKAMETILHAQVLLLLINKSHNAKGILTNKLFEYLSVHRPILAIGPVDGDVAKILSETGAGRIFDFQDTKALKEHVLSLFDLYSQNKLYIASKHIEKYDRKNLTGELAQLLNRITS